jgi:hypothetical protein
LFQIKTKHRNRRLSSMFTFFHNSSQDQETGSTKRSQTFPLSEFLISKLLNFQFLMSYS